MDEAQQLVQREEEVSPLGPSIKQVEEGTKVPEVDAKEYGFRWYPIRDRSLEPILEKGRVVGEEPKTVTRAFILKKAPRVKDSPTPFDEDPDRQRFVAIVSERYVVLPNEYVNRVANRIARRLKATEVTQQPPDFEREWYLHKEFTLPEDVTGLGATARRGFIVENAVNKSHALIVSPTVVVDNVPLVAGERIRQRLLRNAEGRRMDYRRHTKNMVEETLDGLISAAVEASEVWSQHCQWLSNKTVGDYPHVVQELLKMRQKPLPNRVFPDVILDNKGNILIDVNDPAKWPPSLQGLPLLRLYHSVAAQIRGQLDSSEERKTGLLEALAQPFAAADMLAWISEGGRT